MVFSVVIPTFNRSNYLIELLECLVVQTFTDFEVLICDDGSKDNTKDIVNNYRSKLDIRYFYEDNWGGPAKPRNVGVQNANSDWVCFLDSDDLWYPNKLMEVYSVLNAKIDVIYHFFNTNEGENKSIGHYRKSIFNNQLEDLLFNGNKIVNSSLTIRRSTLIKVGNLKEDKKLIGVEDYDLLIRLAKIKAGFFLIEKDLGLYRLNDSNISSDYLKQLEKLSYLLSTYETDISFDDRPKMKALISYLLGLYYLNNQKKLNAKEAFRISFIKGSLNIKIKSLIRLINCYF